MNAGELSIRITAEMAQFDRDMAMMTSRASMSGRAAGSEYASQFSRFGETIKNRLQSQLAGVMKSIINPMAFGMAFVDGMTQAIKTGNVAQAYVDMVQSLPIAGQFANLLTAIYDSVTGESEAEVQRAQHASTEAFRRQIANERKAKEKRDEEEVARARLQKSEEVEQLRRSMADTTADIESAIARKSGDERKAIALQIDREVQRLYEERNEALNGATDAEKKTIEDVYALRRKLILEEGYQKLRVIENAQKEQEKADRETAEKKEIEDIAAATDAFKRHREFIEQMREEEARLEEERIAAQTAGISTANTALGTFKFDAYPAVEKRKNDDRIVSALESINRASLAGAGGFS